MCSEHADRPRVFFNGVMIDQGSRIIQNNKTYIRIVSKILVFLASCCCCYWYGLSHGKSKITTTASGHNRRPFQLSISYRHKKEQRCRSFICEFQLLCGFLHSVEAHHRIPAAVGRCVRKSFVLTSFSPSPSRPQEVSELITKPRI